MTSRIALSPDTILIFGSDTRCTVHRELGRGGSCIVYDGSYRTNAGDEKTIRIRECYPFDLRLHREADGSLICDPADESRFREAKAQMYEDFRLCNSLFAGEPVSDSIITTINIYEANHTVYIVSAWARENTLPTLKLNSLRDCLTIVRQTAYAIQCIHQAGYLYLDIKPDNISVVSAASKRVQLFDFDSLIPITALKHMDEFGSCRLSYTKGFAALELRRGQFPKLSPQTDVYGIGALLFFLLLNRTPEAPDCVSGAVYDFSRIPFGGPFPDRLYGLLSKFFRKTLAGFPPDRYPDMASAVRDLEAMEHLADPIYPWLISTPIQAPAAFIGRSAELEQLAGWARDESRRTLFLSGMGGIGKSTLVRSFLTEYREHWDSAAFLYFNENLRRTLLDDSCLRIKGTERLPEEKENDYFARKLDKLREIAGRDRILLVVDNFADEQDPDLPRILALPCDILFITRHVFGTLNLPVLQLNALPDPAEQEQLFAHYLGQKILPEETDTVRAIIRRLSGHTLALELFARQIANSFLTLPEALELLEKQGLLHIGPEPVDYRHDDQIRYDQLEAIITRLFETDSLSDEQTAVLKAAALFPAPGIAPRELMRLAGMPNGTPITQLIRLSWITRDESGIYLHPLIRDIVRSLPETAANQGYVENILRTLHREITAESHKEETNLQFLPAGVDPYTMITDHRTLLLSVNTARGVIDALTAGGEPVRSPLAQQLRQAMVVNLPKHEDEAILHYGMDLIDHPEGLSPLELIRVIEVIEKVRLERQDFDTAFALMRTAEQYCVDEITHAEYCGLISTVYDTRYHPGDQEEGLRWLEEGIKYARKMPPQSWKHLLGEYLLGKLNYCTRSRAEDEEEINGLIREAMDYIRTNCLPYSEITCGFALAMGFYWAECMGDREETDKWLDMARVIAEKLYPSGLDYIDNIHIPAAIMYIDMQEFEASADALRQGIRRCEEHADLIAYRRKSHDLHRYLLDVYMESQNYDEACSLLPLIDEGIRRWNLPDTVQPEVRQYLQDRRWERSENS